MKRPQKARYGRPMEPKQVIDGSVIALLTVFVAVAELVWDAFTTRRSAIVAPIGIVLAGLATLLSCCALVESESVSWAVGYGLAILLSAAIAGKHLVGRLLKSC